MTPPVGPPILAFPGGGGLPAGWRSPPPGDPGTGWPQPLVRRAGAARGPTSASRASAADVAPGGCCPRAAGSVPCVSTGSWGLGWGGHWGGGPCPPDTHGCPLPAALCSFGCGSGLCIAPNLCSCPDGEQGITCPGTPPLPAALRARSPPPEASLPGHVAPCHLSPQHPPAWSPSLAGGRGCRPWGIWGAGVTAQGWGGWASVPCGPPRPCFRAAGDVRGVRLRPLL